MENLQEITRGGVFQLVLMGIELLLEPMEIMEVGVSALVLLGSTKKWMEVGSKSKMI